MMEESGGSHSEVTPKTEQLSANLPLHRSEGKVDNSEPDLLDVEDSVSDHLGTVSVAVSERAECPVKNSDLRSTVSSGDCPCITPEPTEDEAMLKSFVKAVHEKYNDDTTPVADVIGSYVLVPKSGPVKLTASGNIVLPKQVSMSGCEISVAGDPTLIQKMCQKVKELDLMENNITDWAEVFAILECIPHLTFLNLTKNLLKSELPDLSGRFIPKLTHLVLNNTLIQWDVLLKLLEIFPSLEELHLSLNGFESVDIPSVLKRVPQVAPPPSPASQPPTPMSPSTTLTSSVSACTSYPSLRKLFFIGNRITSWREINKLGLFFPNLVFLLISETDIKTIDDHEILADCFPCLQTLGLNRTLLASWEEIELLRLLPSLTDIRLNGIPFLEEFSEVFRRQHTIALLPNITNLNGSRIGESEREDAERAYIRLYLDKEGKSQRYHELVQQHGKVDPLAKVILKPQLFVMLKIRVEDVNQELLKMEDLNVDVTQTVRDLKKILSNIAGRPPTKFQLYYLDKQVNMGADKLRFMDRKIFSYNMTDGDEIIVAFND